MIQITCGDCGQELKVPDSAAGKKVRCPKCQAITAVPAAQETAPPPAAVTPEDDAPRSARDRDRDRDRGVDRVKADRPARGGRDDRADEEDDRPRRRRRDEDDEDGDDGGDGGRGARRRPGAPATSGKAVAALIFGLLAMFCFPVGLLLGLPAVILGGLAMRDVSRGNGAVAGTGLAVTGLITGILGLLMGVVAVFVGGAALIPGVAQAAQRAQMQNNMMQIGLAMHNHHSVTNELPPAAITDNVGKPLLSWRVAILPYLEQEGLYRQFKLDEPWDSPNNRPLLSRIPKTYLLPGRPNDGSGRTHYQVFVGKGSMFERLPAQGRVRGLTFNRITDGTSNTIMVAEAANPVEWTKPDDLKFDPNGPLPPLGGNFKGLIYIAMGDGSVRSIPASTPEATIKAAITRDGGEPVFLP